MSRYIVKIKDYYLEWSSVTDSPVTFGMKIDEFKSYYSYQYGIDGMEKLSERLERVEKKNTSSIFDDCSDLFLINRAGPEEDKLTEDEIYQAYCLMKPIRKGWVVPVLEYQDQ